MATERASALRAKAREVRRLAAQTVLELHGLADEHDRHAIEIERAAELCRAGTNGPPRQGVRPRPSN